MSRVSAEEIARQLGGARKTTDGWIARCPAHEDKTASLSISETSDGKLLVHCHASCSQEYLIDRLRALRLWPQVERDAATRPVTKLDSRIVMPVPERAPAPDFNAACGCEPEAVYAYLNANGQTLGFACRIMLPEGKKRFLPLTLWVDGAGDMTWQKKGFPEPRPLYGLDELARNENAPVLVVEGEKAADAARHILPGYAIISWPNGANAAAGADWSALDGRDVIIWPDNDEPGRKAAAEIGTRADEAGAHTVRIVTVPAGLPEKWDLADPIPDGLDIEAVIGGAATVDTSLARFVMTAREMRMMDIPQRSYLIEPFLPESGLMMVYARRGLGKTWFGLTLSLAVARGENFLSYDVPQPRSVLYIDGEMSLAELHERLNQLDGPQTDDLMILSCEFLARERLSLNINAVTDQQAIDKALERLERNGNRPYLIVLDNLSSLGRGIDENDNSALDSQLSWLVSLRHRGYAVMLIHHAGKSGDQRGASRREDVLDTTIKLEPPEEDDPNDRSGATFIMEFTKTRGMAPDPMKQRLALRPGETGCLEWQFARSVKLKPCHHTLRRIYEGVKELDGKGRPYRDQKELGQVTGTSKGTVSKHMAELAAKSLVSATRGGLRITARGAEKLTLLFGELPPPCPGAIVAENGLGGT